MNGELQYLVRGCLLFVLCLFTFQLGLTVYSIANNPPSNYGQTNFTTVSTPGVSFSEEGIRGKKLFQINCASCHGLFKDLTGPSLIGVESRWPNRELLKLWIKDWRKAVATKDPYAVELVKKSPADMNVFEFLKEDEIESILVYLKESEKARTMVVACL